MANHSAIYKQQWIKRSMSEKFISLRWHNAGFTYIGILILIAIIGIASAATLQVGSVLQRRVAEQELLAIGQEFQSALSSYANVTPPGQLRAPKTLQELLKDPRSPTPRRHLRKLYADPLTGKEEWGVVNSPDGIGIIGIYSLSEARPIKIGNFDVAFKDFEDKTSYRDWKFIGVIQTVVLVKPGLKF
jgi:type II secretory pathway pseudopilin PulG